MCCYSVLLYPDDFFWYFYFNFNIVYHSQLFLQVSLTSLLRQTATYFDKSIYCILEPFAFCIYKMKWFSNIASFIPLIPSLSSSYQIPWHLYDKGQVYPNDSIISVNEVDDSFVTYHACSNFAHPDSTYKRCQLFNLCIYRDNFTYFLPPSDDDPRFSTVTANSFDRSRVSVIKKKSTLFSR